MSRRLSWSAIVPVCLLSSGVAMAGLFGGGPLLRQEATFESRGVRIEAEFPVRKKCSYQMEIWLHHRQARMGDFDAMVIDDELPVTFTIDVYSLATKPPKSVAHLDKRPRLHGRGERVTTFILDDVVLEKGRYRADLRSTSDASAFTGVKMEFAIQVRPKTRC